VLQGSRAAIRGGRTQCAWILLCALGPGWLGRLTKLSSHSQAATAISACAAWTPKYASATSPCGCYAQSEAREPDASRRYSCGSDPKSTISKAARLLPFKRPEDASNSSTACAGGPYQNSPRASCRLPLSVLHPVDALAERTRSKAPTSMPSRRASRAGHPISAAAPSLHIVTGRDRALPSPPAFHSGLSQRYSIATFLPTHWEEAFPIGSRHSQGSAIFVGAKQLGHKGSSQAPSRFGSSLCTPLRDDTSSYLSLLWQVVLTGPDPRGPAQP